MAPKHPITYAIPTFLLVLATTGTVSKQWLHHQEVFGGRNYYLTVVYPTNPDGVLAGEQPKHFTGTLVTDQGELQVTGTRRKLDSHYVYALHTDRGNFEGSMPAASPACPRYMKLSKAPGAFQTENLRFGSCPN